MLISLAVDDYDYYLKKGESTVKILVIRLYKLSKVPGIERTPFLFSAKPKYYSVSFDNFSTYCWCIERELAFVCLLELLNYSGKVVPEGNYNWSDFINSISSQTGEIKIIKVIVDNTCNGIYWDEINANEIENLEMYQVNSSLANWYNLRAQSQNEKQRINNFIESIQATVRIEKSIVNYLNKKINTPRGAAKKTDSSNTIFEFTEGENRVV